MTGIGFFCPLDPKKFWDAIFEEVDGNRITTVPKTVETDRTIAIEPLMNVYLQLGVDRIIRQQLRTRWGYDLDDQTKNQVRALVASILGKYVTVDLTAASDLIAMIICMLYLPPLWYDYLCDLRSPQGDCDGTKVTYGKISSMGNGYTFALESLIFGALVRAAIRRTRSEHFSAVYGDDLIVPTTAYSYLRELLSLSGFRINEDKTFTTGPFRESCGVDVFNGYNVRPVFLKQKLDNLPALFYIHNAFVAKAAQMEWPFGFTFSNVRRMIRLWIPIHVRTQFFGPIGESWDTHLFVNDLRKLKKSHGVKYYWKLTPRALIYNRGTDFFFRKLMVKLMPSPARSRWDWRSGVNSGNAFDVTRRGAVKHICTRCTLY
jgi:hypothetical protein